MWQRTVRPLSVRCYSEAASLKEKYYNELGTKITEGNREEWDAAKPYSNIPGPKPTPFIGNSWRFVIGELKGEFLDRDQILHKKYGDIVALKEIGALKDMVLLYNTKDIEKMFRNEGAWPIREGFEILEYYRNEVRKDIFKGSVNLLNTQGKAWFDLRTVLNPIMMQPAMVQKYIPSVNAVASEFVEKMKELAKRNDKQEMPKNFYYELNKWAFESVALIALDTRLGLLGKNPDPDVELAVKYARESVKLMFILTFTPMGYYCRKYNLPPWKKFVKYQNFFMDLTFKKIDEAEARINSDPSYKNKSDEEKSIFQVLLEKDKSIARFNALDNLAGGIDTAGKTLATLLYLLARNTSKQAELRKELLKVLPHPDSPITKEVLAELPYLRAVIKESNRVAPIVPGSMRTMSKDVVLGGYQIPAGTPVFTSGLYLTLYGNQYVRPHEFIPERWLRGTEGELSYKSASPFVNLPFGFGPRSCIGKRFAMLELEVAVAKIIRNFNLYWPYPDIKFGQDLMYGVQEPLTIQVKEITD